LHGDLFERVGNVASSITAVPEEVKLVVECVSRVSFWVKKLICNL